MSSSSYYHTGYVWRPDRRTDPRVRTDSMLSVEQLDGHERVGHILDLSPGGIRFQSVGSRLTSGEVVRIAFKMDSASYTVFGKAVRIKNLDAFSQEVALAFTGMDPERRETLRRDLHSSSRNSS